MKVAAKKTTTKNLTYFIAYGYAVRERNYNEITVTFYEFNCIRFICLQSMRLLYTVIHLSSISALGSSASNFGKIRKLYRVKW